MQNQNTVGWWNFPGHAMRKKNVYK